MAAMISSGSASAASAPTHELVRETLEQTRELIRIEFALARNELNDDLAKVKRGGVWAGVGVVFASAMFAALVMALVLALGGTAVAALAVAGGCALLAAVAAVVAFQILPRAPLQRTRARLESEVNQLKEHVA
jgi:Flp pilus assembly protein TadB